MKNITITLITILTLILTGCTSEESTTNKISWNLDTLVSESQEAMAEKAMVLVNEYRESGTMCGDTWYGPVPKLDLDLRNVYVAKDKSIDLSTNHKNTLSHSGSGNSKTDITTKTGDKYNYQSLFRKVVGKAKGKIGENISNGFPDIENEVVAYQQSPNHCRNMMDPKFTKFGWYSSNDEYGISWGAQEFSEN